MGLVKARAPALCINKRLHGSPANSERVTVDQAPNSSTEFAQLQKQSTLKGGDSCLLLTLLFASYRENDAIQDGGEYPLIVCMYVYLFNNRIGQMC